MAAEIDHPLSGIALSFEYFGAGPGCGGIAELWTTNLKDGILVTMEGDVSVEESHNTVKIKLSADAGWREVCAAIIKQHAFAFFTDGDTTGEYAWPFKIQSKGPHTLESTMITLVWAGPPLSAIVEDLSQLDDLEIRRLLDVFGDLDTKGKIDDIIRKFDVLKELEIPISEIINDAKGTPRSLKTFRKNFLVVARRKKNLAVQNALERSKALSLFRAEIERIVVLFRSRIEGRGWAFAMARGQRGAEIKQYLEDFVLKHGSIPEGRHIIKKDGSTINFDDYKDGKM